MIPKIIHRVWLSDELPDINSEYGKCFYSQEKLKDSGYEIRTYTSKNFDFSISKFLLQAYSLKQWAFVTDYIRLWALYNFGGIYLDCDVEVIKDFDELLPCKYFFNAVYDIDKNREIDNGKNFPKTGGLTNYEDFLFDGGVIGAEPHNHIIKLILDYYDNLDFIEPNTLYIHNGDSYNYFNRRHSGPDFFEYKACKVLSDNQYNKYEFIEDINEYINLVNNSDITKDVYILNTEFCEDFSYWFEGHVNENCICVHKRLGEWHVNNSIAYLNDYPLEQQEEYFNIYDENKSTNLSNDTYILLQNNSNLILKLVNNQFIIDENNIINDINQINIKSLHMIINYDNIDNIKLFKYLLKNLPNDNCIITNNYEIININTDYNIIDNINDILLYKKGVT